MWPQRRDEQRKLLPKCSHRGLSGAASDTGVQPLACAPRTGQHLLRRHQSRSARQYVWEKCKQSYYRRGHPPTCGWTPPSRNTASWLNYGAQSYRYQLGPHPVSGQPVSASCSPRALYDGLRAGGRNAGACRLGALRLGGQPALWRAGVERAIFIVACKSTCAGKLCAGLQHGPAPALAGGPRTPAASIGATFTTRVSGS